MRELKKGDKLQCMYVTWWGEFNSHWYYEVKTAWKKIIKLELYEKSALSSWLDDKLTIYYDDYSIRIKDWVKQYRTHKNSVHITWKNHFVSYCNRAWIPFIFNLLWAK